MTNFDPTDPQIAKELEDAGFSLEDWEEAGMRIESGRYDEEDVRTFNTNKQILDRIVRYYGG